MKTSLSQNQIQSYQQDGYLLVENFLSEEELVFWRTAVTEAVRSSVLTSIVFTRNEAIQDDLGTPA